MVVCLRRASFDKWNTSSYSKTRMNRPSPHVTMQLQHILQRFSGNTILSVLHRQAKIQLCPVNRWSPILVSTTYCGESGNITSTTPGCCRLRGGRPQRFDCVWRTVAGSVRFLKTKSGLHSRITGVPATSQALQ